MPLRGLSGWAVERAWRWVVSAGTITVDHPASRRFFSFGPDSHIRFPMADLVGEAAIAVGDGVLIAGNVTLAVGMPSQDLGHVTEPVIRIGDRTTIGRGCSLVAFNGIEIAADVTIAPDVYITDHNHTYGDIDVPIGRQFPAGAVTRIGTGCWLGTGVVVTAGTTIGRHVAVAANSVVRGDVPDHSVIAGAPARVVRRWTPETGWDPPLDDIDIPSGWDVEPYPTRSDPA